MQNWPVTISNIDRRLESSVHSIKRYRTVSQRTILMVYTLEEVADILRVSVSTVRKLIKEGKLKTVRVGIQLRVKKEDLDSFLNQSS
jgi:DNA binding domain, excisionase family